MARPRKSVPTLQRHRASNQAKVRIDGRDIYLGKWGSKAARNAYARIVATSQAASTSTVMVAKIAVADPVGPTIAEVCRAFIQHAEQTYRKNGQPTSTIHTFKTPIKTLRTLYGDVPARDFGPLALEAVRGRLIELGLSRGVVNGNVGIIRRVFRWATSRQLVPVTITQALSTLEPLRAGRTDARETGPIRPVDDAVVERTLSKLSPVVADMVRLQRRTGMRPGELCQLRPVDIDRSVEVWAFTPVDHKTLHHDQRRVVLIGPKAQAILLPYLQRSNDAYCFSPKESAERVRGTRHKKRTTPPGYGNTIGTNRKRKPARTPGERYDVASYRRAITRACEAVGVEQWHPHQLRHSFATEARKAAGLEAVQGLLGHATMNTSQIYAERRDELAREVATQIG